MHSRCEGRERGINLVSNINSELANVALITRFDANLELTCDSITLKFVRGVNDVKILGLEPGWRGSFAFLAYDKTRVQKASTSSVAASGPMPPGLDWK